MAIDINELLALPEKERKEIARKLWNSLSPSGHLSDKEIEAINGLENRWDSVRGDIKKIYASINKSHHD
jgi:hypothetical protein